MDSLLHKIFNKSLHFSQIDPLADGLGDEIEEERREPQAISFESNDEDDIQQFWSTVDADLHAGGGISFSDGE